MKKTIVNLALFEESGMMFKPVSGFSFEHCGLSLCVHKQPGGKLWAVTETSTGAAVCKDSKTRAAAVDKARSVLDLQTPERIAHAIDLARQALSKHGKVTWYEDTGKPSQQKPAKARKPAAAAKKPKANILPEVDYLIAAVESDEGIGFCLECGNEQGGCEPDARNYVCKSCGARKVFGAEEIILMGAIA